MYSRQTLQVSVNHKQKSLKHSHRYSVIYGTVIDELASNKHVREYTDALHWSTEMHLYCFYFFSKQNQNKHNSPNFKQKGLVVARLTQTQLLAAEPVCFLGTVLVLEVGRTLQQETIPLHAVRWVVHKPVGCDLLSSVHFTQHSGCLYTHAFCLSTHHHLTLHLFVSGCLNNFTVGNQ